MGKSSENYLLSKKAFRAILYDWDTISTYGDNTKLYCLTDFQASFLQSNVEYMAWSSRWENCPCTDEDLRLMASELEFALMDCIDFQPYQIDYTYQQAVGAQLGTFNDDYTGVPSSVNPNTPDDFFSGDGSQDRTDALCTALKVYVYSYAQNWVTKAQIVLALSVITAFVVSLTLVGGIIAGTIIGGLAFMTQIALDAMSDEDTLDEIVCCMFTSLTGTVINQANWDISLDACGFAGGSNEAIVRDIIASDIVQFDNYLSFLNALGDQYVLSQAGVSDCPCASPWSTVLDFTLSDYGATFQLDDLNNPIGQYSIGFGFIPTNVVVGGVLRRQISVRIPFDSTTVTDMNHSGDYTRGTATGGFSVAQSVQGTLGGSVVGGTTTTKPFTNYTVGLPVIYDVGVPFAPQTLDGNRMIIACSYTNYTGTGVIETATLEGTGIKPTQFP